MSYLNVRPRKKSIRGRVVAVLIVAAVLGILAAIAIPDFLKFAAPPKQLEAKTNLGALFTIQMAYHGQYKIYAGGPNCFELLGWAPKGETMYTYWCDQDSIGPTKPGVEPAACSVVPAQSSATGFTVCAAGNVDKDPSIDEWIMPDNKNLTNTHNDVGD